MTANTIDEILDAMRAASTQCAGFADQIAALAAPPQPDTGLDVEAVLRQFLTGDGFIAECDIQHIVAALTAQPAAMAKGGGEA